MITKLSISNFKSIRQLDLDCKKVNLFIGEPNTGKSNILEALALLSWCGGPEQASLNDYVRLESTQNLFYDQLLDQPVEIKMSTTTISPIGLRVTFERGSYGIHALDGSPIRGLDKDAHGTWSSLPVSNMHVKFFRFRTLDKYDDDEPGGLKPPDGPNLFSVVLSSRALRETMTEFFRKYGLMLVLEPHERVFKLQKHADGLIFSYPYSMSSDTLRRIIFYTVAIASNKDSVLVFEEPESNAFPYYTKYLGERIALDETNQFFIATHNPYLLSAIIEKGRKEDVQVFITYFKDYQTKVKPLTPDEVTELMEADPFFNLDRFVEEGQ
jgi:hypothetical protein